MSDNSASGHKPVLVDVPANYQDLPEDQQERFLDDLTDMIMGTFPADKKPYRPDDPKQSDSGS